MDAPPQDAQPSLEEEPLLSSNTTVPPPDNGHLDASRHEQQGGEFWESHAWPTPADPADRAFVHLGLKRTYKDHVHNPFYYLETDRSFLQSEYDIRDWPIHKIILNRERETVWEDSLFEVLEELHDKNDCLFPLLVFAHHNTPEAERNLHFSETMLQLIEEHLSYNDYDFTQLAENDGSEPSDQDSFPYEHF